MSFGWRQQAPCGRALLWLLMPDADAVWGRFRS